jgi:ATP-dependent Clp protease ATP-binding subunit ClpC
MFERYTEKARRVIFFARYEASQFGGQYIETEHLLMGLLREDKTLANQFLRSHSAIDSIRKQIEGVTPVRDKVSTSVDLPLSPASKRILAFGAEESERLGHKYIGTGHLLAGVMREEKCFAAEMLTQRGISLDAVREILAREPEPVPQPPAAPKEDPPRFKIPPGVLKEITRQASALGVDTYTHLLAIIRKGIQSPEVQAEVTAARELLRENYQNLRGRIKDARLPFLDAAALDDEIARRKGKWKQP